jgi:hypothetical protein
MACIQSNTTTKHTEVTMNNNKQSSVELFAIALYEKGFLQGNGDEINDLLEQHKAIHVQEHGNTWDDSMRNLQERGMNEVRAWEDFDEYYNETYGGNK